MPPTDLGKWERLAGLVRRVEHGGLRALSVAELEEVGRLYRQAAVALARERTRGREPELTDYLNALVARAHNSIYGRSTQPGLRLGHFFAVEIPRTFRAHLAYLGLAAGLFALFSLLAYGLVVTDENWAERLSPAAARQATTFAEQHQAAGKYFEESAQVVGGGNLSAFILSNNVKAAFSAFGLGLTAGLGTILVLFLNGMMLGVFLGIGATHGALADMIAVVAPHGVLELSAFAIAAGAGFVMGFALIAPGDLTRGESLARGARQALRLALGAAVLLVPAALVEGLVSPQSTGLFASNQVRILFGVTLAALGWLYLFAGDVALGGGEKEEPLT